MASTHVDPVASITFHQLKVIDEKTFEVTFIIDVNNTSDQFGNIVLNMRKQGDAVIRSFESTDTVTVWQGQLQYSYVRSRNHIGFWVQGAVYEFEMYFDNLATQESVMATPWLTPITYLEEYTEVNTGYKAWATLEQYNVATGVATGTTKPNDPGDPDYVAPVYDPATCPLP